MGRRETRSENERDGVYVGQRVVRAKTRRVGKDEIEKDSGANKNLEST